MAALTEQHPGALWASRLALLVTPVAALVQAGGFAWAFWRYVWGFGHPAFSAPIGWLPPGGWLSPVLFIVAVVVLTGLVLLQPGSLLRSARRRAPRQAASGTLRGTGSAVTSAATAAG